MQVNHHVGLNRQRPLLDDILYTDCNKSLGFAICRNGYVVAYVCT